MPEEKTGAIVPQTNGNTALTTYQEPQGYHNGFTKEDVRIPRVSLMQPISDAVIAETAKSGEYLNSVTGENYGKELEFILLAISDREIIRGKALFVDKKMKCWSINRMVGDGDPGGACVICNLGQWTGVAQDIPPECFDQYTYLGYVLGSENDLPAAIMLGKTSMGTAKAFNLIIKGLCNAVAKGKKLPFGTVFKLFSEKKSNEKGTFYINKILKSRDATDEERDLADGLYDSFSGMDYSIDMGDTGNEFAAGAETEGAAPNPNGAGPQPF